MAAQRRLYYDQNCPLCQWLAQTFVRHSLPGRIVLVPTDYTDLARLPVAVDAVIYEREGQLFIGSAAIREALRDAGYGWPLLARLLGLIPQRWRDNLYNWVARRRPCAQRKCSPSLK